MKVLIVLTSNARRGAEIEGARLAAELTALGVEAEAVALAATPQDTYLDVPVLGRSALGISTLRELRRRARYVDVVIAYGSSSLPACAVGLLGSKVPFVYRSIGDPAAWVRGRFHRWRTGVLLRRSAHVVALWPAAAAALESLYSIEGDRISVITNARSPEEFRPPSAGERKMARQRFALGESEFIVGVVGSLSAEKRVDLAIDAVARVPDARALVVGDGPLRLSITERACTTLGSRAVFTGAIDNMHQAFWAIEILTL